MAAASARSRSLRRRILTFGIGLAFLILVGLSFVIWNTSRMRDQLSAGTDALIEEQQIADRISQAVMRQLVTTFAYSSSRDETLRAEFREEGEEAYEQIRQYLFRDLNQDERLQLERIKEEHQKLEVAAVRAADLYSRDEVEEAEASVSEMIDHSFALLGLVDGFLRMREADLELLRARQSETFQVVYLSAGVFAILLLFGSLFLAWFLHRRVARPLAQLTGIAGRIGAGDLEVSAPPGDYEEFAVLSQGFNRMVGNLRAARSDLERRNQQLLDALAQVREAQNELVQAEKLSAMGRMTAGLAHELNNPLATVLGYGELLSTRLDQGEEVVAEEIREEYLGPILQEAMRAQHLVRSLLQLSRRSEAELGPVDLREAMELVAGLRRYAFQQAGLELVVEELPACRVIAERQRLQGVFLNITNNALDAMSSQGSGELRVSGSRSDSHVEVLFEDDGPGLEHPERIFEPFFTTKPVGAGTGLGLALVHRFMYSFGGSVRAENQEKGGARFVLRFQVADGLGEEVPRAGAPGVEIPAVKRASAARILVVEDEDHLRRLHERLLRRLDAQVFLAASTAEAREILEDHEVDVVISDVKMPGESGLELYRWVAEHRGDLANRFLFVTGDVGAPEIVELSEERPEIFIHKPFDIWEYLARVGAVLE